MGRRNTPIIQGEIYHVFNRGIGSQPIFHTAYNYARFLNLVDYYRFVSPGLKFSRFNVMPAKEKQQFLETIKKNKERGVDIFSYCLMPNHYHLLVREIADNGLRKFIGNLQNSYAKYLNTKMDRAGSLFQEMFKAVRIENDEQFVHVSRYIHLNPLTSCIVSNFGELENYRWSSLPVYLKNVNNDFLNKDFLASYYPSVERLREFIRDQADYQKKMYEIEHLIIEWDSRRNWHDGTEVQS